MPRRTPRPAAPILRIGFVCAQLEIGGQESGMLELLRRMDRTQFAPHVYAFRDGPLLREIRKLGIPVVVGAARVGPRRAWSAADSRAKAAFRRRLAEMLRADRIDVCLVYAWADALPAAREAGVPAVVERVDGPKLIGWVRDKSSCQRVICESESIGRLLHAQRGILRCESVPIVVIPNGIDLERFDPEKYSRKRCRSALDLGPDDFVAGTVARLTAVKNLGHVLDAAKALIDRLGSTRRIRVIIAGPEGGAGASLREQARALGIAGHVRFLGPRADVPVILRALDVFVLTSFQEGMPFALLEAMAMGLPVVATHADSISELVRDNGFLVGPLDPMRTTFALRALAGHAGLRQELGRRSRLLASAHDLDRMVRRYEQVLRAAFKDGVRQSGFRRRVVVMPGHRAARKRRGSRVMQTLFRRLRADNVDAYALGVSANGSGPAIRWPPGRRQSFAGNVEGAGARKTCLEWIQPDVLVTDCARMVIVGRQSLPGEEIVFMPDPKDPCSRLAKAVRLADRILAGSAEEFRAYTRRWPASRWKIEQIPDGSASDRDRFVGALLAGPRPAPPRKKR